MLIVGASLSITTPSVRNRDEGSFSLLGASLSITTPSVRNRDEGSFSLLGASLSVTIGEVPAGGFVHVVDLNRGACILTPSAV